MNVEAISTAVFKLINSDGLIYNKKIWEIAIGVKTVHGGVELKEGIHPAYNEAKVSCACGETFVTKSTRPQIQVDICSKCHPFFTGKHKAVDAEGRVAKFNRKYEKSAK
jgi:large subunit ribosomal protein L31